MLARPRASDAVIEAPVPQGTGADDVSGDVSPGTVSVVTVAYDSADVLPALLDSVPDGVEAIVVDNASRDASAALARERGARVIEMGRNAGFGTACNAGAAVATGTWLAFVNPDAVLDPGALNALLRAARRHPHAGGFNPTLMDAHGHRHVARRTPLAPRRERLRPPYPRDDFEVPSLSGAALFVLCEAFERVGGFDERIFLFFEDDDLSARLRREIGPLVYVHDAVVRHDAGHGTPPSFDGARLRGREMARAKRYVLAKHARPFAQTRVLGEAIVRALKPKNALDPARRAYAAGFWSGALATVPSTGAERP